MKNDYLFEVDESVERAMHEECLDGKMDLMADMMRGHHARTVIAEINHAKTLKAVSEQTWNPDNDFQFELQGVMHGQGFHQKALEAGTYDIWDTNQSDYLDWTKKRFPENRLRHRSQRTTIVVADKYSPPRL